VSYRARRDMQIWSPQAQVEIDFATRRTTAVEPVDTLVDFDFNERDLSPEQKQQLQKNLFAELLPAREQEAPAANALVEEQRDFLECIRTGRAPRVPGEQGRIAVAAAESILASIRAHHWEEGRHDLTGPLRIFAPSEPNILRGPHWDRDSRDLPPVRRKEAG
jgi:hypothetical protein